MSASRPNKKERAEAEWQRQMALPESPVNPDKLQGPDVDAAVIWHSKHDGDIPARVTARSYIWSPEKVIRWPDGSVEEWMSPPINRYTTLKEGTSTRPR